MYIVYIHIFAYAKSIIRRDDKKEVDKDQGFIARKASPVIRILCVRERDRESEREKGCL